MKKIIAFIMMLAVLILPLSVSATSDINEKGSITISLTDSITQTPIENMSFKLYHVAKARKDSKGIRYDMISPYDKAGVDLSDLQDSYTPIHLAYFSYSRSQPYTEKSTDENGTLVFDNLEHGLYLIVPVQSELSDYVTTPFLISVPTYDIHNETYENNVEASPKIRDRLTDGDNTYISVMKKWNTDKTIPQSITVVLLRDYQEYEKIELNSANNWYYRWDNLPKKYIWSVVETEVPEDYTVYYETSSNTVNITNKSDETEETIPTQPEDSNDKLVQTGQLNWPVPVCVILGLIFFSIGWAMLNFGKKENE